MPLTEYQALAVRSRGGARLVSAAAGSGKTRVLVERLLRAVEEGADIDAFIVVTFTRAAAGELRSRITAELTARLAASPDNAHLRRQLQLVYRAPIGTIDSLCGRFLRENTHLARLTPDFRVAEPDRAVAIRSAALERVLDRVYETIGQDPAMAALVDAFGAGRDDKRLSELVLRLHTAVQSDPNPSRWLREQREHLAVPETGDAADTVWGRALLDRVSARAAYWEGRFSELYTALLQSGNEKGAKAYGPTLSATLDGLRALIQAIPRGWDAAAEAAEAVAFPKALPFSGPDARIDEIKAAREACKKAVKDWDALFSRRSAALLAELRSTRGAMEALLRLTETLDRAYTEAKARQNVVDFSDQEHRLLELLEDTDNGLAASLSARYAEVLVDEYQDVNACQDRLFTLLSDGGRKLFCVGDVKQSVYRFRQADPTLFLEKFNAWPDAWEGMPAGESARILLRENFRSRWEILAAVNHVFRQIMSPELGELRYDESSALRPGRALPPGAPVELAVLSAPETAEDEERPDGDLLEARYVAAKIRALAESGEPVSQGDGLRPARWGDFAILLRGKKAAGAYRAALLEQGIPSVAQQGGGFFKSLEVTVLTSLLAVIDNPRQDVPLISVLTSPLFGFTADELSAIRGRDKTGDFYTALCRAADGGEKCRAFLHTLNELRSLAPDLTVEALLGRICRRTELFAILSAMPDGAARRENVHMLLDYARQYEQGGYQGVHRFLDWLRTLAKRGEEPRSGSVETAQAVQIISIHHSKGLEYPIVFLCGTGSRFNLTDLSSDVLFHPALGVGGRVVDTRKGVSYPSLAWLAVRDALEGEQLSEEMRVLYVAMTRAKDRLFITGRARGSAAALRDKLSAGLCSPLPPELLRRDKTALNWLLRAALLPESPIRLSLVSPEDAAPPIPAPGEIALPEPGVPAEDLAPRLGWRYGPAWAASVPSKVTASALHRLPGVEEAASLAPEDRPRRAVRRPSFVREERPLTGAERGTAVHAALQFMDFRKGDTPEEVREELARLLSAGRLTPEQAAAVEPEALCAFFRSQLGRRAVRADALWRELRFSVLLEAERLYPVPPGEKILLQGVVDCCFREGDGLVVLDYKTDAVTPDTAAERAALYAPQLRAYAAALERVLGLPVRETALWFLALNSAVTI